MKFSLNIDLIRLLLMFLITFIKEKPLQLFNFMMVADDHCRILGSFLQLFKQVQDLIDKGYAREIPDHSAPPGSPVVYLPLLVVTRDDKPGKFRVCQDAAAKVKGVSLNKHLLNGPNVLNDLIGVLLRFRRKKVVLSADISSWT